MHSHNCEFFEDEIHIHYEYIRKFLMTITGDHCLATEIVQETMAIAWVEIHKVKGYKNIRGALIVIARNKLYDYYKKNKMYREVIAEPITEAINIALDEGLLIIKREERRVLLKAIGNLSKIHMKIILLRYYYEQSFVDVAKLINMNYNTVLSHHRRAIAALKKNLRK